MILSQTRNAMHCNNHDDLLQLHFKNVNVFSALYITLSNIYDGAFIEKIVTC